MIFSHKEGLAPRTCRKEAVTSDKALTWASAPPGHHVGPDISHTLQSGMSHAPPVSAWVKAYPGSDCCDGGWMLFERRSEMFERARQ